MLHSIHCMGGPLPALITYQHWCVHWCVQKYVPGSCSPEQLPVDAMQLLLSIDGHPACFGRGTRMAMNALMNAYASAGDAPAAAAVLGAMQRRGPRPNDISYNTAIAAHAQARLGLLRVCSGPLCI